MQWMEPWESVETTGQDAYRLAWEQELTRELCAEHPLYGLNVKLIGRRYDCDDALFQIEDGRVAMVHLTWKQRAESDPRWPSTTIYLSLEAWRKVGLCADHADWLLAES